MLFGLEETLPVLELLVEERLDSNSEMIEEASVFEVVSVSVVVVSDSAVVSDAESSGDLHPASINPSKTRQIRNERNCLMGPQNPNLDKRVCVLRSELVRKTAIATLIQVIFMNISDSGEKHLVNLRTKKITSLEAENSAWCEVQEDQGRSM